MRKLVQKTVLSTVVIAQICGCTNSEKNKEIATENVNERSLPNIVYVLCDDLGYGDINVMAPEYCKIPTPSVDQLAGEGMIFTNAHSGSSVCTPTSRNTSFYFW